MFVFMLNLSRAQLGDTLSFNPSWVAGFLSFSSGYRHLGTIRLDGINPPKTQRTQVPASSPMSPGSTVGYKPKRK
jgi:hypothetical protein